MKRSVCLMIVAVGASLSCSSTQGESKDSESLDSADWREQDNGLAREDGIPDDTEEREVEEDIAGETTHDMAEEDITSADQPPVLPGPVSVEVLDTVPMEYEGLVLEVKLLKLTSENLRPTYAQWIEVQGLEEPAPVVVQTMPYDIVDWTGESIDEQSAAMGDPVTPEEYTEQSFLYLIHNFHVLGIFGRFYTEDSITNDVQDMLMGLSYLPEEPDADLNNIVIWGASWGGFEAVYGAAYAPEGVRPKAGMALAPLGDFEIQTRFWTDFLDETVTDPEKLAEHQAFRAPYLTRIYATTGGHPDDTGADYTFWNTAAIAERIDMPFLLVHDTWDSLVPFESSQSLADANDAFDIFWVEPEGQPDWNTLPLDHGLRLGEFALPAAWTFATGYLIQAAARPAQTVNLIFDPNAVRNLLEVVHQRYLDGTVRDWMPERLVDLAKPTVMLFDVNEELPPIHGAQWMAEQISDIWQVEVPVDSVASWLIEELDTTN